MAILFRKIPLPHFIKYGLFIFLRGRSIPVKSQLKISRAKINLNLGSFIDYWIFVDGSYEGIWISEIKKFCTNKVIFDIGANIGVYSLSLYKVAKCIYAFEPERKNFNDLVNNLKINSIKNIKPIMKAMTEVSHQTLPLHLSDKDTGWHSLSISYGENDQMVKTVSVDDFVESEKIQGIGLIKIDVEGAELGVLKGAKYTLSQFHPVILIEFNKPRTELAGYKLNDLYLLLDKHGYQGYRLINNRLEQIDQSNLGSIYNENVLFRHKSVL